ncbi:HD-GYP domain-containing protein [Anaeromicropila herbilytica]|uniref:HD-GYP domain-containing protein n=1 Tax=Anaeromicropila herbilytica TaxID=2785025 RepID=A0A7R7EK46_9FIRM|nr:HD domain-containing phosphohydrolase [Anaeromicropila herbilytica]BCN29927.1 hypothetical protein bsdtb5_12220 [Anaeromicropila herbilytica]
MKIQTNSLLQSIKLEELEDCIREDLVDAIHHGMLVSNLARLISKELNLDDEFCEKMKVAGMLHDIGKLKLTKHLYGRRKDILMIEEMKYVRMHSTISYEVLEQMGYEEDILKAIYHHHENFDGSGYPDNIKGNVIPLGARILRVCDVFAALVSVRPYRKAFDIESAIELMIDEIKNFDMQVFLAFLQVIHSECFKQVSSIIDITNKEDKNFKICIANLA